MHFNSKNTSPLPTPRRTIYFNTSVIKGTGTTYNLQFTIKNSFIGMTLTT